jgi:hypothetical protein
MSVSQLVRGENKTAIRCIQFVVLPLLSLNVLVFLTNIFKPTQKSETTHKKVITCLSISNEESYRLSKWEAIQ